MTHKSGASWIAVKSIGISPLSTYLEKGNLRWYLYPWDSARCKAANAGVFQNPHDTLTKGIINDHGNRIFFIEAGLRITKSYATHIVFFFDHHPSDDEINSACGSISDYDESELDTIDLAGLLSRVRNGDSVIN